MGVVGRRGACVCVVETGELPITLRVRRVQSLTFKVEFIAPNIERNQERNSKDVAKRFLVDALCIICLIRRRRNDRLIDFWHETVRKFGNFRLE